MSQRHYLPEASYIQSTSHFSLRSMRIFLPLRFFKCFLPCAVALYTLPAWHYSECVCARGGGGARSTTLIYVLKVGGPRIMFKRRWYISSTKFCDRILTCKGLETRRITLEKLQEGWSLQVGVPGGGGAWAGP